MVGPGAQAGTAVFINDANAYGVTECSHISDVCESVRSCLNPMSIPWGPMGVTRIALGGHGQPMWIPWAPHVGMPCLIMDTWMTPWEQTAPMRSPWGPHCEPTGHPWDTIGGHQRYHWGCQRGSPWGSRCEPMVFTGDSMGSMGPWDTMGPHGDTMGTQGSNCDPVGIPR